jgi:starch phosphorylase
MANPALSNVISDAIGDGWTTDFSEIAGLKWLAGDAAFRAEFLRAKREAKSQFSDWLQATCGQAVDPTASSTARSSASMNTSARCSMRCGSSCSTIE